MTKDLVEKVAAELKSDPNLLDWDFKHRARAAIAAVAEWLDTELRTDDADPYVSIALLKQLEQPK